MCSRWGALLISCGTRVEYKWSHPEQNVQQRLIYIDLSHRRAAAVWNISALHSRLFGIRWVNHLSPLKLADADLSENPVGSLFIHFRGKPVTLDTTLSPSLGKFHFSKWKTEFYISGNQNWWHHHHTRIWIARWISGGIKAPNKEHSFEVFSFKGTREVQQILSSGISAHIGVNNIYKPCNLQDGWLHSPGTGLWAQVVKKKADIQQNNREKETHSIPEVRAEESRQGATKFSKNNVNRQVSGHITEPTNCMTEVKKRVCSSNGLLGIWWLIFNIK